MCGLNRASVRFRTTHRRMFSMSKLSHFGKGMDPPRHLFKLGLTSPKDALYQFWLKMAQWFWNKLRNTDGQQTTGDQKTLLD